MIPHVNHHEQGSVNVNSVFPALPRTALDRIQHDTGIYQNARTCFWIASWFNRWSLIYWRIVPCGIHEETNDTDWNVCASTPINGTIYGDFICRQTTASAVISWKDCFRHCLEYEQQKMRTWRVVWRFSEGRRRLIATRWPSYMPRYTSAKPPWVGGWSCNKVTPVTKSVDGSNPASCDKEMRSRRASRSNSPYSVLSKWEEASRICSDTVNWVQMDRHEYKLFG